MTPREFVLRSLRKVAYYTTSRNSWRTDKYVQYFDQDANDFIRQSVQNSHGGGYMIAKFGTNELDNMHFYMRKNTGPRAWSDFIRFKRSIFKNQFPSLWYNMGFFPYDENLASKMKDLYLEDIKQIDILASYIWSECYLKKELSHCAKVNLDGFYAPFMWENPWTGVLAGKRVLVVHPFTESIKKQYARREKLFDNPEVLPEFQNLICIKAVQTIAGTKPDQDFATWFDALQYMKDEITAKENEFDAAIIGCGAYGLPLAAHVKRMGKIAIHLAGWTQMLFGIYGGRWINDQPQYAKFVNEYWIRPDESERPKDFKTVENGCYW